MATSLDPYFNVAYRFGAIFRAKAIPAAPAPDQSVALLRKPSSRCPIRGNAHDIAFVYYWHLRDYKAAAVVSARCRAAGRARLAPVDGGA
jgi:hypothetical protein